MERATRDVDAGFRRSQRSKHASPLLHHLKAWRDEQEFLPKSLIGKAGAYTRDQWHVLNVYLTE